MARRRDPALLGGLEHIGVDELSYRRHHEYVTTVVESFEGVLAIATTGVNNGRTEGLNGKIRVTTR